METETCIFPRVRVEGNGFGRGRAGLAARRSFLFLERMLEALKSNCILMLDRGVSRHRTKASGNRYTPQNSTDSFNARALAASITMLTYAVKY